MDKNKLLLVIGGSGTIGKALLAKLNKAQQNFLAPTSSELDLLNDVSIYSWLDNHMPSYIINLAAVKTNFCLNEDKPFDIYADTVLMNSNLFSIITHLGAVMHWELEKILSVVCSCSYWDGYVGPNGDYTLQEENFDFGRVHSSVEPHGYAKRSLYYLSKFVRKQYGLNSNLVALNNVYGGEDWSRPETFKVLSALVKKFVDARNANAEHVVLYGTGAARREFIHRDDAAEGILRSMDQYDEEEILNIGCNYDVQISKLASGIALAVGYKGRIAYDSKYGDGQMKKLLNSCRMIEKLNWEPEISLADGVDMVIADYTKYTIPEGRF